MRLIFTLHNEVEVYLNTKENRQKLLHYIKNNVVGKDIYEEIEEIFQREKKQLEKSSGDTSGEDETLKLIINIRIKG